MRLARLERVFERNPIYFVTACTHERGPWLCRPEIQDAVKQFADRGPAFGAWLGAYVLMPDHWHGFVALDPEKTTLSAWMKSFKNTVSKALRTQNVPAPHWQQGFFDHVLRSGESYRQKWNYVRENLVRAGFIEDAEAWPFQGEPFDLEFRHDYL